MSAPEVFIALPVFQGREVVAQTLRSIREQSFASYRVLISVDANDTDSAKACGCLTADPRVTLVVQPKRLGWAGNLNWLIEQCDCPFFCYWQQDDLTQANYLEALHAEMTAYPDTAIAYADVQWFGSRSYRDSCAGIHGPAAQRVLQAIEAIRYEPLRGLIRAEFLPRHEAIAITGDNSCHMEFPFMAGLAARGAFRRVGGTLYYKRAHRQSISEAWNRWPPWRRRRAWIDMGLGFFRVAQEAVPDPAYRRQLLATIIDRLAIARVGRSFFYEPEAQSLEWVARITRDLVARGNLATPPGDPAAAPDPGAAPFFPPIHPHVEAALDGESRRR